MIFTDAEQAYLTDQRIGRLATQQPDGSLQVNPVGFRWNPERGTIDIGGYSMSRSRKFRNVEANGRVAFVVDDIPSVDPWRVRCLDIRGSAEAVRDPDDSYAIDGNDDPAIIRIHPSRVIGFGVENQDLAPHEMVPNARSV